ncbi:unnamed protein product [Rotaria socialis]|uniref:PiggyBac transposable element-derived protein domain-containing protein n=1 Tax=Rotaria socialis TaxID=392032 RepID=A0A820UGB2_9BILA|nr:unnamed protein product [Rotaria socialis]CAF4487532.1 unnamed protein product [Rotaria socialis]
MSLTSDEEIDSSESEDEVSKVAHNLRDELIMSETSSSSDYWRKTAFVPSTAAFAGTLPPPPMNEELEPIDYFFSMVDKKSIALLTDQSNLYVLQTNPSKPVRISEVEMSHFIGILIMTGIYCFPEQRFFWMNTTRVESISSVMSRDRSLEIKKYLHVVDNQSN